MSDTNIARRYARALVELAVEAGAEQQVQAEITRFFEATQGDGRELGAALCSPVFNAEERAAVLAAVVPRLGIGPVTAKFLRLLSERGRMELLPAVARLVSATMDERAGVVRVQVATVDPLTPQLEHAVRAVFERATGKRVILDARIDASLIGGLVARIGDKVFDASLASRLDELKRRLIQAPATAEA
jgi:F-type H+-transporting ATPase subunit delta